MADIMVISGREVRVRRTADEAWRRRTLLVATVVLAVATVLLAWLVAVSTSSGGRTHIQLGTSPSDTLFTLLVLGALSALAVGIWLVPVSRPALFLLIPARVIACCATVLAAMGLWLMSDVVVTPVLANGCHTGYVVREEVRLFTVRGILQRQDGIFATDVATIRGDHAFTPFAAGAYAVVDEGDTLHIRYSRSRHPADAALLQGAPEFIVPRLVPSAESCSD